MPTPHELLAAARQRANNMGRQAVPPSGLSQEAQALVPVLARMRLPLNAVTVRMEDLAAAAGRAGSRMTAGSPERLAARMAALSPRDRTYVADRLAQGLPAKVSDGENVVAFMLVSGNPVDAPMGEARQPQTAAEFMAIGRERARGLWGR